MRFRERPRWRENGCSRCGPHQRHPYAHEISCSKDRYLKMAGALRVVARTNGSAFFSQSGILKMIARATQRVSPVESSRFRVQRPHVMQVTMFLPQFVREKKRDDQ
jgi:hypothetical protein